MGDRVLVRDSGEVQGPIVSTRSPVARGLLGDHVQWRCPAAGGGPDDAKVQHSVKLMAGNLEPFWG